MRFLVFGDLHLKPRASDYDLDGVTVPEGVDAVLVLGDLTHRDGPDDVALARRFVERLDSTVPVVYLPGNHDHAPMDERVVESVEHARTGHRAVHEFDDVTVVGFGCERRTLSPALDQRAFDALDTRDIPQANRRYDADRVAANVEAACRDAVCGEASRADAADALGIDRDERRDFYRGLEAVEATYETLTGLLESQSDVLLATHVPPFNTSFDRHHAHGGREEDLEHLHTGSIAIKLAVHEHDVFASLSGHSHAYGYDSGDREDGSPHCLNFGKRGIGTVTVEPARGVFTFSRMWSGG